MLPGGRGAERWRRARRRGKIGSAEEAPPMSSQATSAARSGDDRAVSRRRPPTPVQRRWLERGLAQPGGKLPLFDEHGRAIHPQTIQSCVREGWARPWIRNSIKPDWLVCKLTPEGRAALGAAPGN